jgi:flavodoxin
VVYDSKFGNTEKIAQAIAARLEGAGPVWLGSIDKVGSIDASDVDLLVVGGPTHGHGTSVPMRTLLGRLADTTFKGVAAATFDTRFHMMKLVTGSAALGIARWLTKRGAHLIAPPESFFVTHSEGPLEAGEIERAGAWADQLVAAMGVREKAAAGAGNVG